MQFFFDGLDRGSVMGSEKGIIEDKRQLLIANIIIAAAVILAVVIFCVKISSNLKTDAINRELKSTAGCAFSLGHMLSDRSKLLELMAESMSLMAPETEQEIREALTELEDPECFDIIRYADGEGTVYTAQPGDEFSVSGQQVFESALKGEKAVSDSLVTMNNKLT